MAPSFISNSNLVNILAHLLKGTFLATGILTCLFVWLEHNGELMPPDKIVETLTNDSSKKVLYGPALHYDAPVFKRAIICDKAPSKLVLGSSRVMKLDHSSLLQNSSNSGGQFYNAGGTINDVSQALSVLSMLETCHQKLSLLLIGFDFWWFSKPSVMTATRFLQKSDSLNKVRYPPYQGKFHRFGSLASKAVFFVPKAIFSNSHDFKCDYSQLIGLSAKTKCSGFDADGVFFFGTGPLQVVKKTPQPNLCYSLHIDLNLRTFAMNA